MHKQDVLFFSYNFLTILRSCKQPTINNTNGNIQISKNKLINELAQGKDMEKILLEYSF